MSVILTVDRACNTSDSANMEFSIPMYNNIFIIQADTLDSDIKGIYYGDGIDLEFWGLLNLLMDSGRTYTTSYELTSGYTYTYYVSKNKFVITDSTDAIVFENDYIKGINDFCVDSEIESSHQFHVVFDPFSSIYSFYKVATLFKKYGGGELNTSGSNGVQNEYIHDRVRPYLPDDLDNPVWNISLLDICEDSFICNPVDNLLEMESLYGHEASEFDCSYLTQNNNFYSNLASFSTSAKLQASDYVAYILELSLILPDLSTSMFPQLLPVAMARETTNTRPVYEPWLIWKVLEFITSKITVDNPDKDYEVLSFDLSPVYAE